MQLTSLPKQCIASLHQLAAALLSSEHRQNSLQPTLLVNEAFIRLVRGQAVEWQDRKHFFVLAARTMRHILVHYFRERSAQKRPPKEKALLLNDVPLASEERWDEVLLIDEALTILTGLDPRVAQVVELRSSVD